MNTKKDMKNIVAVPIFFGNWASENSEITELVKMSPLKTRQPYRVFHCEENSDDFKNTLDDLLFYVFENVRKTNLPYAYFFILDRFSSMKNDWFNFFSNLLSVRNNIFAYPIVCGLDKSGCKKTTDPNVFRNSEMAIRMYSNNEKQMLNAKNLAEFLFRITGGGRMDRAFPEINIKEAQLILNKIQDGEEKHFVHCSGFLPLIKAKKKEFISVF